MFHIRKRYIRDFSLDENTVILFRVFGKKDLCISKILKTSRGNGKITYSITIKKDMFENLKIKSPCELKIEIIDKKPLGYQPGFNVMDGMDLSELRYNRNLTIIPYIDGLFIFSKLEGTQSNSSFFTVPRNIKYDKEFCWNMGFYLAEGLKCNENRVSVSNSESYLLKRFQDFLLKYFKIEKGSFFHYVKLQKDSDILKVKDYWSKKLSVDKNNVRVSITKVRPPKTKYGNCEIVVYNSAFSRFFMSIFKEMMEYDHKNENLIYFLRGLEAGDGYVMEHGGLEMGIVTDIKHANNIFRYYKNVYKDTRKRNHHTSKKAIIIYFKGRDIASEFLINGHFSDHFKRRRKLISLLNYYLRKDLKYLNSVRREKTIREIEKDLNLSYRGINIMLRKLERQGYVTNRVESIRNDITNVKRNSRVFNLTQRGEKLLKCLHCSI